MPCICNNKVERGQEKIKCPGCNEYFHCSCMKLNVAEIEFMKKSGKNFYCNDCTVKRRTSINPPPFFAPSIAAATTAVMKKSSQKESPQSSLQQKKTQKQQCQQQKLVQHQLVQPVNSSTKVNQQVQPNYNSEIESRENTQQQQCHQQQQYQQQQHQQVQPQQDLLVHSNSRDSTKVTQLEQPQLQNINNETENTVSSRGNESSITLELVYNEIVALKTIFANAQLENTSTLSLIKTLQEEKQLLSSRVDELEREVNFLKEKSREKCIEIVGVPGLSNNNALDAAIKIFSEGLDTNINESLIDDCYVKNIKTKDASGNNSSLDILCVKLVSLNKKKEIMRKRFTNKNKLNARLLGGDCNRKIFLNENLSLRTRNLLKAAQKFKLENNFKFVWVRNGKVLMRKKEGDSVIILNTIEDLRAVT